MNLVTACLPKARRHTRLPWRTPVSVGSGSYRDRCQSWSHRSRAGTEAQALALFHELAPSSPSGIHRSEPFVSSAMYHVSRIAFRVDSFDTVRDADTRVAYRQSHCHMCSMQRGSSRPTSDHVVIEAVLTEKLRLPLGVTLKRGQKSISDEPYESVPTTRARPTIVV